MSKQNELLIAADEDFFPDSLKRILNKYGNRLSYLPAKPLRNNDTKRLISGSIILIADLSSARGRSVVNYLSNLRSFDRHLIAFYNPKHKGSLDEAIKIKPRSIISIPYTEEQVLATISHLQSGISKSPDIAEMADIAGSEPLKYETIIPVNGSLYIKQRFKFHKLKIEDIWFLKSEGNHTYIQTAKMKFILRMGLQCILDQIGHLHIMKVHRSYAINLHNVDGFDEAQIHIGKHEIPLGKNYKADFLQKLKTMV